ncbi:CWF complex protein sap62 [Massospora cicadina]|nr:CWF complex protein sap62 [Massospora cicadina]
MDFQNRVGSKPGSGGVLGASESNVDRRERLRKLALETIDLAKDPYFMKNHLGSYECKLCLTLHTNEGSYLEAKEAGSAIPVPTTSQNTVRVRKNVIKIGRPGYKVTKLRDPVTRQFGFLFQIQYPEAFQYVIFAAEPYETIAFKVQSKEIDKSPNLFLTHWDKGSNQFSLQFFFKVDPNANGTNNQYFHSRLAALGLSK